MKKIGKILLLLLVLISLAGTVSGCSWAIFEPPPVDEEDSGGH